MKTPLLEIKKGQIGKGLLIERDGYISLDMPENKQLKESIEGSSDAVELPRPFVVSAVFQKYGIENANGRIYPENILKREVEKYQKVIEDHRAYGESDHPEETTISLDRIALNIIELHWVGHTLVGKIVIPITEGFRRYGIISSKADNLAQLIVSGLKVGVSSRAIGSVQKQMGRLIVGDDLELVCWDAVSQPSTPGAYIDANEEGLEQYFESEKKEGTVLNENVKTDKYSKFDKWLTD